MKTMVWMAVAGVVWTCWGCKDENGVKKGKDEPWVAEIKSFERDELKVSDILARIDTVELYTDGKAMASIGDLCFLDSMVDRSCFESRVGLQHAYREIIQADTDGGTGV